MGAERAGVCCMDAVVRVKRESRGACVRRIVLVVDWVSELVVERDVDACIGFKLCVGALYMYLDDGLGGCSEYKKMKKFKSG